jgi:hypothetical protein
MTPAARGWEDANLAASVLIVDVQHRQATRAACASKPSL